MKIISCIHADKACPKCKRGARIGSARSTKETRATLPPDPDGQNEERAAWALHAVRAFQEATGSDDCDAIADLICDLAHLCDRMGAQFGTFERALERKVSNYKDETLDDTCARCQEHGNEYNGGLCLECFKQSEREAP